MNTRIQNDMPDVPELDYVGALCELWLGLNYAAYHLAYVRVYLQTAALQTDVGQIQNQDQCLRDMQQTDLTICRAHLAALFWQLEHIFEGLRIAVRRGKREQPLEKYFPNYEQQLDKLEQHPLRQEIKPIATRLITFLPLSDANGNTKEGAFFITFCQHWMAANQQRI